ncbi:MAG: site-specific integrase [Candidatus Omnitrophota bacterium]
MSILIRHNPGIRFREGEGAVDKRGRHVCQIDFYPFPNKRVYKTIKLARKSYREAAQIRSEWMKEYAQNHPYRDLEGKREQSFEGLRKVLLRMMESTTINNRAEPCASSTINKTMNIYDRFFVKFLGSHYPSIKQLNNLPKGVFLDYLTYNQSHQKLNWRTELGHLKSIISRLWRSDYCDDRIYKEIRTLPTPKFEIRNKVVLSLDEKKTILADMEQENREYYVITYFLAKLGWRINETLSLKKNLIRWKDGNPVSITLEKPFRKNRKEFTLTTIDKKLAAVIVSYLHWQTDKSEWFFPNSKGKMIKKETYRGYLHKVSTRVLKRNVNPHDFRHSLITHLKGVRVPNKDIMQITGHMDERVLNDHYSHSTETGRMEALELSGL